MQIRTGIGYDLHRIAADRPLVLGGVKVSAPFGLAGHSDADCVLHALCDSLLGAVGADDIGTYFPDTDPANAGADSRRFVRHALEMVRARGYRISNVDCVIMAERPRLGPLKPAIRESIEGMLELPEGSVGVKAKTGEEVGAIGRGEAIAAMVTVLLIRD